IRIGVIVSIDPSVDLWKEHARAIAQSLPIDLCGRGSAMASHPGNRAEEPYAGTHLCDLLEGYLGRCEESSLLAPGESFPAAVLWPFAQFEMESRRMAC